MTTTGTSREAWQNNLWTDMIDDEDADSDTDSRLSGSVIVDSVMRRLQKGYRTERSGGGGEFTLDPIADHSLEETDGPQLPKSNGVNHYHHHQHYRRQTEPVANGFQVSPSQQRRTGAPMGSVSPKMPPRHLGFGGRRDMGGARDGGIMHPFTAGRRKDPGLLSPVPENFSGLGSQNKSSTSDIGAALGRHGHFSSNLVAGGPMHRSMEIVPHNHKNSPTLMNRPPPDGYRSPLSHSTSPDSLTRSHSEHNRIPSVGANISRHGSIGPSPVPSSPYHHYKSGPVGPGRSPQLPSRFYHDDVNHHHDAIEHQVSGLGHTTTNSREPNLNDVVDFLSNPDPSLVANAASYLQHLAYGDDNMKAKIRQFGGIPALVRQIRSPDSRVQLAVLGALRNLSYGRANNDNKIQIASDIGLPDMGAVLKSTHHTEIRELITSVLWNLSSCDDIKLRILQCCLRDIIETILIPHSGCTHVHLAAKDFSLRPNVFYWSVELKNSLGTLRNISSAGEAARKFLRGAHGLVDTLVWIVRASSGQDVDEKTAENAMCILRNLSYQIEVEIDPQDGVDDDFDKEWERQVQQEIDEATEAFQPDTKNKKSLLLFCARPRTADNLKRNIPQLIQPSNLSSPDPSLLPKRTQPPRGTPLLWQPEIIFPYLALLEKYTSTPDLMEAAAGALQNLTACSWKWSVYQRHIVRKANGLTLLIDLLNHAHDTVVRSAATALRNLATDPTNKLMIGAHATRSIIPRLPYGQNNLGISEPTTIALLCTLMEVCVDSPDNARVFREAGGIPPVVRLTQSREHTPRVTFAAHKLCSIIFEFKFAKSHLKQEGWDIKDYQRLLTDSSFQLDLDPSAEIQHNNSRRGSHDKERKKRNNSDPSEVNRMQQARKDSLTNVPTPSHPTPPGIEDIDDPAYHMIDSRSKSQPPKPPPAPVIPVSMYAEINDPELQLVRKQSDHSLPPRSDSQAHSHTGSQPQSEPRSSPIDQHTTGSITPHEGLSSDEQTEPGNATYAQIDYGKKRESRRRKQQEQKHQPPLSQTMINPEAIDSWV